MLVFALEDGDYSDLGEELRRASACAKVLAEALAHGTEELDRADAAAAALAVASEVDGCLRMVEAALPADLPER